MGFSAFFKNNRQKAAFITVTVNVFTCPRGPKSPRTGFFMGSDADWPIFREEGEGSSHTQKIANFRERRKDLPTYDQEQYGIRLLAHSYTAAVPRVP